MINWKARLKNKAFWGAMIPAILLLIQAGAAVFGLTIDLSELGDKLLAFVNTLFTVLVIGGVVIDTSSPGVGDREDTLTHTEPINPLAD